MTARRRPPTRTSSPMIAATSSRASTSIPTRVVDLALLRPRERQVKAVGEALRERPTAEREHPGALDAALADERDVRRAAADVDEQRARLADLLVAEDARDGVRLGDDLDELEVELVGDRLERARGGPAGRRR